MDTRQQYRCKILLLVALFITSVSLSQKPAFGIKAGFAFSNSTITRSNQYPGSASNETSPIGSFLAGVYVDVPVAEKILFRPEVVKVSKGVMQHRMQYNYPDRFPYIDFPMNFLYQIKSTKGRFIIGGGPSIGIPLNKSFRDYQVKTEFGANGLMGYELPIGVSLNANYNYGLNNVSNNNRYISKITNRYLGIALGYTF